MPNRPKVYHSKIHSSHKSVIESNGDDDFDELDDVVQLEDSGHLASNEEGEKPS
jgi:hypothetical protein